MPTPASGTISMGDMRSEITRGSGAISMSEVRTRYGGGTSAISFNELYDCEGWVHTNTTYTSKFFNQYGWSPLGGNGGLDPNEGGTSPDIAGSVIFTTATPGSRLTFCFTQSSTNGNTQVILANNSGGSASGPPIAGYRGTDVTRIVIANTARSIVSSTSTSVVATYTMPGSGQSHCLIKF